VHHFDVAAFLVGTASELAPVIGRDVVALGHGEEIQ
jgi:hypothetical protein